MFIRKDITDLNPNENLHQMANDLIFTSAGELMQVIVEKEEKKKTCNGECECQDCDDDHGDNVTW